MRLRRGRRRDLRGRARARARRTAQSLRFAEQGARKSTPGRRDAQTRLSEKYEVMVEHFLEQIMFGVSLVFRSDQEHAFDCQSSALICHFGIHVNT